VSWDLNANTSYENFLLLFPVSFSAIACHQCLHKVGYFDPEIDFISFADSDLLGISDCGRSNGGYYILNQGNLDEISSCTTIYSGLQIVPAPGETTLMTVTLPSSLTTITGALDFLGFFDAQDATISINGPGLVSVGSVANSSLV
jgi:hypothetical protein